MTQRSVTMLPADGRSAARARRIIEAAVGAADLGAYVDEALLLVTELVTNAVVHAGTIVELDVETGDDHLRVEVTDQSPGSLPAISLAPIETREGGRGLFLIEALATEWGTRHFGHGKSVWFVLGGATKDRLDRPSRATVASPPARRDISWLAGLPADLERRLTSAQLIGELLHRLVEGVGLQQGWLYTQSADDDRRWEMSAAHDGTVPSPEVEAVRWVAQQHTQASIAGADDAVVLSLQSPSGVFGAVVLQGGSALPAEDIALARLVADRMSVVIRDDRAHASQLRSRGSLALLAEASEMFAGTLDVQLTMTLAAQLVVPRFASWAVLCTTIEREAPLLAIAHTDENQLAALRVAMSGDQGSQLVARLAATLGTHGPVLVPSLDLPERLRSEDTGEVLAVPLLARRRMLGVLLVGRPANGSYSADDLGLLADLARRAAVAIDSARLYEERTSIARALQASLLPPTLPVAEGLEFGARYAAAGEGNDVGGDFYDVFTLADGGWALAIGDVCGKGPEAAAITGMARDVLRLLTRDGDSPPDALQRLNTALLELGDRGRLCTATLGTVHERGDDFVVCLSSAGHPPPVLLTHDGGVSLVGRSGTVLGVVDDVELSSDDIILRPGDSLVFYTDGVTERRSGDEMFGDEHLLASLARAAGHSADALAGLLERDVESFSTNATRDDLAVLVVRSTRQPVAEFGVPFVLAPVARAS
jgi:sigma-B regulation protein RsbU (phosphoserine phosphatase)